MAARKTKLKQPVKVKIPAPESPTKKADTISRRLARRRKKEIMAGR